MTRNTQMSCGTAMHKPGPNPSLEDARLELARRRYEAVRAAVKENLVLLEQLSREVRYGGRDDYE